MEGLVIDLRNNGGGSLQTVVDMAGLFIKEGPIVQVKSTGKRKDVLSDTDEMESRIETGNANLSTSALYYGALDLATGYYKILGNSANKIEKLEQRKHKQQIVLEDIEQWLQEAEKGHQALGKDIQTRQTNIDKLNIDIEGYRVRANTILEQLDETQQSLKNMQFNDYEHFYSPSKRSYVTFRIFCDVNYFFTYIMHSHNEIFERK